MSTANKAILAEVRVTLEKYTDHLPSHMVGPITEYVLNGHAVGGFLQAVLENNLVQAYHKADEANSETMKGWASLLHNALPHSAWGSPEKVKDWQKRGGLIGLLGLQT